MARAKITMYAELEDEDIDKSDMSGVTANFDFGIRQQLGGFEDIEIQLETDEE